MVKVYKICFYRLSILLVFLLIAPLACFAEIEKLSQQYDGDNGTLEVGGAMAGAEFHHSRPLPSRISFFYPVANSIDPSDDYWRRDQFSAMHLVLKGKGMQVDLVDEAFAYDYTPASAIFNGEVEGIPVSISYEFGDQLPILAITISITNSSPKTLKLNLEGSLDVRIRTSHTYAWADHCSAQKFEGGAAVRYDELQAGNASLAMLAVEPRGISIVVDPGDEHQARFLFKEKLKIKSAETFSRTLLVGMEETARLPESLPEWRAKWRQDVNNCQSRVEKAAFEGAQFELDDEALLETFGWSRAVIESLQHYLDGAVVPMPCPAQYNFYFTHDVLVTDLGVVRYDLERVKKDLLFIQTISTDTVLAHAYYWKDDRYVTEFCLHDSWNHFWFIQLAALYLRHGGDPELIRDMLPLIRASHRAIESQLGEEDNLAYGTRPDWWDIGNVYGARTYLTANLIRAEREAAYIDLALGIPVDVAMVPSRSVDAIQKDLEEKLWSDNYGYLMNSIGDTIEHHIYAGSLVASAYGVLNKQHAQQLVDTATDVLLDPELGIRNVMPPDFHLLEKEYKFNGPEAGGPWLYANGAVWPQGNAWYALAQMGIGDPNGALETVKRYMTIDGIAASPNGLPSFYEFRHSEQGAADYGQIEKPTFLWAGGWYVNCLYGLAGLRETPFNLALTTDLPDGFENAAFDMTFAGELCQIEWEGEGEAVESILWDGAPAYSLVLYDSPERIEITRGPAEIPCLVSINAVVKDVAWIEENSELVVELLPGFEARNITAQFTAPEEPAAVEYGTEKLTFEAVALPGGYGLTVQIPPNEGGLDQKGSEVHSLVLRFN